MLGELQRGPGRPARRCAARGRRDRFRGLRVGAVGREREVHRLRFGLVDETGEAAVQLAPPAGVEPRRRGRAVERVGESEALAPGLEQPRGDPHARRPSPLTSATIALVGCASAAVAASASRASGATPASRASSTSRSVSETGSGASPGTSPPAPAIARPSSSA